jgi:CBS domain-containing protein
MAENDCGVLPVVGPRGEVVGMLTDRDVCLAVGTLGRHPAETLVRDVMTRDVALCHTEDDVHDALAVMANRHVRRLPVLDAAGALQGVLSTDDLVLRAEAPDPSHATALSSRDVFETLRTIYGTRRVRVGNGASAV